MKIIFPELDNPIIIQAIKDSPNIEAIPTTDITSGCQMLAENQADAMIAGINCATRDMVLSCKEHLPRIDKIFSSCFVMRKGSDTLILADGGVCKRPDTEVLETIVTQTYATAKHILKDPPRIAMLSFSTFGSGGKDSSITTIQEVITNVRKNHPKIIIDGEMQLDTALDSTVSHKKSASTSKVAGKANVLICPDLNSGNILYKSMERFGGWTAAGPILQGFVKPVSDLSRGSTVEDVKLVIKIMEELSHA